MNRIMPFVVAMTCAGLGFHANPIGDACANLRSTPIRGFVAPARGTGDGISGDDLVRLRAKNSRRKRR